MSDCVAPDAFVRGRAKRDGRQLGILRILRVDQGASRFPFSFALLRIGVAEADQWVRRYTSEV
jgi:hypothetical protein